MEPAVKSPTDSKEIMAWMEFSHSLDLAIQFLRLDDRFHEIGIDETGSIELEGSWWIPRLRLAERGAVSWQDGVKRSRWR
jgi:hypothetical protein